MILYSKDIVNLMRLTIRVYILLVLSISFNYVPLTIVAETEFLEMDLVNLTVKGNETRIISDRILRIEGVIEVRDNATLVLDNVKVRFKESDHHHGFHIKDNASLILTGSDVRLNIDVKQNAFLNASNSKLLESFYCTIHGYNHTTGGVKGFDFSEILLDCCTVGYFQLYDNSTAKLSESHIYMSTPDGASFQVKDSIIQMHRETIKDSNITLDLPEFNSCTCYLGDNIPGSTSKFENVSLEDGLWLQVKNSQLEIHDSKLYFIDSIGYSRIQLTNVSAHTLRKDWEGYSTFSLEDCNITRIYSYASSGFLKMEIKNSVIEEFQMDSVWSKPFQANISHTIINSFNPGLGDDEPIRIVLDNVTLLSGLNFPNGAWESTGGLELHGDICFGKDFLINATGMDGYAIINRFYPVFFTSSDGPVADLSLVAKNGNHTIWYGKTSSEGFAEIPIKFVNIFQLVRPYNGSGPSVIDINNLTDAVTLSWYIGDTENVIDFNLVSDTPFVIEIPDETRSNYNFLLVYLAVGIILAFYYVKRR